MMRSSTVQNEIRDIIGESNDFYITGHINPDGDSIGACFGLGLALEKMGKKVQVLLEPFHHKYDVIPGKHLMRNGTGNVFANQHHTDPVLICVDCADTGRLMDEAKKLLETLSCTVNIDHHYSNPQFACYNLVDRDASSTCEMIYQVLDGLVDFDKPMAAALYAGMVGDTGGFRHSSTSQETMTVAGKLIALGIPFTKIYTEVLQSRSYTEIKLLARVLDACIRSDGGRIVHVCVTADMMVGLKDAPDATTQDLEGMVEHLLNTRGAKAAFIVYDAGHGEVKISLRSRELNVGDIAQQLGGGGHRLAAGATVKGNIFEIRDRVLKLCKR